MLQNEINVDFDITEKLEKKYNEKIDANLITNVKLKINDFIENKSEVSFVKLK
jgi:hypothetical protein